jgi:hypothetical protein
MSGLLLTREERMRFSIWLKREAEADEGCARQMQELKMPDAIRQRYLTDAAACRQVARILDSIQEETIG